MHPNAENRRHHRRQDHDRNHEIFPQHARPPRVLMVRIIQVRTSLARDNHDPADAAIGGKCGTRVPSHRVDCERGDWRVGVVTQFEMGYQRIQ